MQAWIISFLIGFLSVLSLTRINLIVFNLSWISIFGFTYVRLHYGGVLYSYALFLKLVLY